MEGEELMPNAAETIERLARECEREKISNEMQAMRKKIEELTQRVKQLEADKA